MQDGTVGRVFVGRAERELVKVRLADEDRASHTEASDERRVTSRDVSLAHPRRGCGGRVSDVDEIFYRDRNAVQWSAGVTVLDFLIELFRLRQRFVNEYGDVRVERWIALGDARQTAFGRGFRGQFRGPRAELTGELRRAMRQETEKAFDYVIREDRSLLELLDSDYTFLNERLARHYGLTNLNVTGEEMVRVKLPPESPRGGVITHGSVLAVTSNPTRTSPVKRGLFILDNLLGTPPPPPPPDIPPLEDAAKAMKEKTLTLRETLALHREQPLCSSCHNRMDPLGLALDNFNAMGMWRDQEKGQTIDATGKLLSGESFTNIKELKKILASNHATEFYRTVTEKLLTYALGRGLEYYDVATVDAIVERLQKSNGRPSELIAGIIESAPFQKTRNPNPAGESEPPKRVEQRADNKP